MSWKFLKKSRFSTFRRSFTFTPKNDNTKNLCKLIFGAKIQIFEQLAIHYFWAWKFKCNDTKYRRKIQCECAWKKERSSLSFPLKKISLCVNFASAANFPSRCLLRRKERWTFKSANSINVEVKRVFHANAIKQLRYFGFCACTEAMEKAAKKGLIKCSGALPLDPPSIIWPNCPLKWCRFWCKRPRARLQTP